MRHGSLFSGIGGFDLAAQWMGWENVFQVEWDSYCQKVLAKNFPNVKRYGDIKEFNGTKYRGLIDIISGGFPCQPYSLAGKQKGKADDRHLWPEMLRVVREIQPDWVVGENVPGIINWSRGLVFNEVQVDLETEGYKVLPLVLPTVGRGGIHRRRRVWFVAHSINSRNRTSQCKTNKNESKEIEKRELSQFEFDRQNRNVADLGQQDTIINSYSNGLQRDIPKSQAPRDSNGFFEIVNGGNYPSESPICRTDDGIPNRMDRIKALGNAIVPQVVYQIFKAIEEFCLSENLE
jgi:DNA (cytosine-5)-methyltransferase 1